MGSMGFLDKFKSHADELKVKAVDLAGQHGDKIDAGLDKAADLAKKATKGKFEDQIDSAAVKAKEAADKLGDSKA